MLDLNTCSSNTKPASASNEKCFYLPTIIMADGLYLQI